MELNELLKKISAMQTAASGRLAGRSSEQMQLYVQGFCDALEGVSTVIKQAREAERMRERLARLESALAQEPEADWLQLPEGIAATTGAGAKDAVSGSDAP